MASFTGNINDMFKQVFGIYTAVPIYFPGDRKPDKEVSAPKGLQYHNVHPGAVLFDKFGLLVSAAGLTFNDQGDAVRGDGATSAQVYDLPATTVVSLTRPKNYVQTTIPGKDGAVIELISNGNWNITFRGFVISKDEKYPRTIRKQISEVCAVNTHLRTYSRLLNDLGIEYITITGIEWPEFAGSNKVAPFQIEALSDKPVELEIKPY